MTKIRRPYSRVYWEVIDDPKFRDVWDDDRALATWLRLLLAADMAWPASATLPYNIHVKALATLVAAGLVDRQAGGRYRIHGLDRERSTRSRQASDAAAARWDDDMTPEPVSNADGDADGMRPHPPSRPPRMPSQDEPRRDEQSRDETSSRAPAWDVVRLVEELTGRSWAYGSGNPTMETLRADVRDYGPARVEAEMRTYRSATPGPMDAAVLVTGTHRALMPLPSANGRSSTPKPKGYQPDMEDIRRAVEH